ncbi:MAG: DUF1292 domain-containing protein, partial [Oscillospiraceae bacterium]|nr:DUF1292 domain-containing protein [Oscillospiraceae bacterium]
DTRDRGAAPPGGLAGIPYGNGGFVLDEKEGYFIDLTDEEGNNFKLEIIGDVEYEGDTYRVFLPTDVDEEDPDYGFIILKAVMENDEELLDSVDDEETLEKVYALFMEELYAEDEDDADETEDS